MAETRSIVITLIISSIILSTALGFVFGLLGANNVPIPASASASNNALISALGTNVNASTIATANNLKANTNSASLVQNLVGDFMVFGGIVVSMFGYLAAVPQALGTITSIAGSPTQASSTLSVVVSGVVLVIGTLVSSIILTMLVFEFLSGIAKYRW